MINTMFLIEQDSDANKKFSALNTRSLSSKRLSYSDRLKVNKEGIRGHILNFNLNNRKLINVLESNTIHSLNYIDENIDIILPKTKNILDWVVLWYNQDETVFNISKENSSIIKIYGNGSRIMGYDEPLICDMTFMSLRFTYVNDIDGWIIT